MYLNQRKYQPNQLVVTQKKVARNFFFPFSGALRLFKQKCAVCLRRRDNYRHISSKAFPGFFESIFEWWGKSKAIPSAQNQAPLSTWTSSSWTTAFPSGVKCNPSLQITKKKWLLSYDNQSPYWLMIWIFLLINLKNERKKPQEFLLPSLGLLHLGPQVDWAKTHFLS